MTKVVFYKSHDVYYGFSEQGHTGFAEAGEDILCAAISSMTMLVINTVKCSYTSSATYFVNEDGISVRLDASCILNTETNEKVKFAVSGLIETYCNQLKELMNDYADFLQVTVKETDK